MGLHWPSSAVRYWLTSRSTKQRLYPSNLQRWTVRHTWNVCYKLSPSVFTQSLISLSPREIPSVSTQWRLDEHVWGLQPLQQHQLTERNLGRSLIQHLKLLRCLSVPVRPEIPADFELRRLRPCTGRKAPSSHQPWFVKAIWVVAGASVGLTVRAS